MHSDARQTAYIVAGNKAGDPDIKPDSKIESRLFLSGILVDAPANARAIVTFGDSITDWDRPLRRKTSLAIFTRRKASGGGWRSSSRPQRRNFRRSGLTDRMGVNALARFHEDVLSHPHADTVILMMGINDIGWPDSVPGPALRRLPRKISLTVTNN